MANNESEDQAKSGGDVPPPAAVSFVTTEHLDCLSKGLLAAGDGALECDGHVSASERPVPMALSAPVG